MNYLIVGLGNVGPKYVFTRHNVGFMVLDVLGQGLTFVSDRHADTCTLADKGRKYHLAKPTTFMNLSGKAVQAQLQKHHTPLENLLIVTDDLALPFGTVRLRKGGSDGGHNGLKHIDETLGTQNYARLRVGIGSNFARGAQVDYVLADFRPAELDLLPQVLGHCADMCTAFGFIGIDRTMSQYNKKLFDPPA
jgi:PTH1 family peptidyl-tRNA hydrolase